MGMFDFLFKKKYMQRNINYAVVGSNLVSPEDSRSNYIREGYVANDLIYSVVNLIADKVRVAPWAVYRIKDEPKLKRYKSLIGKKDLNGDDYKLALRLKTEALEEIYDAKLAELLDYPNEHCTFSDLVANSSIYKMVTGGRMIWAELLGGGANSGKPQSLHIIPYQLVTIRASRTWPMTEEGYYINDWNHSLLKSEVLHDKYFNPLYDTTGSHLFGLSPLKAAAYLTTKSLEAAKTEAAQFSNQGPKKIIFVDEPQKEIDPLIAGTQANEIKKIIQGPEYSGGRNAGKIATSGYKMGVIDVGLSPVELGIIESEKWSLRRFCNVFSAIPSQLLNDPENKTYNNQKEGEVALTTRAAIPQLITFRDTFNRKIKTDWGYKGKNVYIDFDSSVYTELQEDLAQKWAWVKELPVSWAYKLEMMGLDEEGQDLSQVMIPSGFQPLDAYSDINLAIDERADIEGGNAKVPEDKEGKGMPKGSSKNGIHKNGVL